MELPAELITFLRSSTHIAVLTGAGVSKESGLRTFRDTMDGLWSEYLPEDLATPEAFERNPGLVWEFYAARWLETGEVQPNAGHFALAENGETCIAFHAYYPERGWPAQASRE